MASPRAVGPLARVRATLPELSRASVRGFAVEMWERNGYGKAATAMIRDVPLFGVGIGAYHSMAKDYTADGWLPPDNAQNWIRHQLVELGVVGSLGWLAWIVLFGAFLVRARRSDPPGAWILRGVLVGISPWDVPTLAMVAAGLAAVTMIACYVPARRVLRIEPTASLRRS